MLENYYNRISSLNNSTFESGFKNLSEEVQKTCILSISKQQFESLANCIKETHLKKSYQKKITRLFKSQAITYFLDGDQTIDMILNKEDLFFKDYRYLHQLLDVISIKAKQIKMDMMYYELINHGQKLRKQMKNISFTESESGVQEVTHARIDLIDAAVTPQALKLQLYVELKGPSTYHMQRKNNNFIEKLTDDYLIRLLKFIRFSKSPAVTDYCKDLLTTYEFILTLIEFQKLVGKEEVIDLKPDLQIASLLIRVYRLESFTKTDTPIDFDFDFFSLIDFKREYGHIFDTMINRVKENKGNLVRLYQKIYAKLIHHRARIETGHRGEQLIALYPEPKDSPQEYEEELNALIERRVPLTFGARVNKLENQINEEININKDIAKKKLTINPKEMGLFTNLNFDDRVAIWFDETRDPFTELPGYENITNTQKQELRFKHNPALILDQIALRFGIEEKQWNRNGQVHEKLTLAIGAKTDFSDTLKSYIFTMTIDHNDLIYHRTLTQHDSGELGKKLKDTGKFKKPPLMETVFNSFYLEKNDPLLMKRESDGSYIEKEEDGIIKVIDPKHPRKNGKPTYLYVFLMNETKT